MPDTIFLNGRELLKQLTECFKEAITARIAVAYLGMDGYNGISQQLETFLTKKKKLTIVVGISSYHITEWQALNALLKLKRKFGTFDARYYNNEGFHPKLFIFETGNRTKAIVGSSNLTGAALKNNVEANLLIVGKSTDVTFSRIEDFWQRLRGAQTLDETVVHKYRKSFRSFLKAQKTAGTGLPKTPLPDMQDDGATIWKVAPGKQGYLWPRWKEDIDSCIGYIALGWAKIGNIEKLVKKTDEIFKKEIKKRVREKHPYDDPKYVAGEFSRFCKRAQKGDFVVAYSRKTIFGVGRIEGPYYYDEEDKDAPFKREVRWVKLLEMSVPNSIMHAFATPTVFNTIKNQAAIGYIKNLLKKRHSADADIIDSS
jgi:HKD family nuclease